jgi:hypothetical protein
MSDDTKQIKIMTVDDHPILRQEHNDFTSTRSGAPAKNVKRRGRNS